MIKSNVYSPIVVVGGGPVGLTMSLELSRYSVPHILFSQNTETSAHPKCNTTNARSMEHFRRLGVAGMLRMGGLPADYPTDICYFTRLTGQEIERISFPSAADGLKQSQVGGAEWPTPEPQHRISQIYVEKILKQKAESSPFADIRFGWEVTDVKQNGGRASLTVTNLMSGESEIVHAGRVVGCDGAQSLVRQAMGIRYNGESRATRPIFGGAMVATYYSCPELAERLAKKPGFMLWTLNEEIRSVTIAIDGKGQFLTHVQAPQGIDPKTLDPLDFLPHIFGMQLKVEVLSCATWNAGFQLVAEKYKDGRLFLAGDSAHLFTPTGGFGMNTGIDDVANLAWKLAAVVNGWAPEQLLLSYEKERQPIGYRNTKAADRIADIISDLNIPPHIEDTGPEGKVARTSIRKYLQSIAKQEFSTIGVQLGVRYEGSDIIISDQSAAPEDEPTAYEPVARPGSRLPHIFLKDGASLYDRLGTGFTLLCVGGGAEDTTIGKAAASRKIPFSMLHLDDDALLETFGGRFILVRPDQHVAWRGNNIVLDPDAIWDVVTGVCAGHPVDDADQIIFECQNLSNAFVYAVDRFDYDSVVALFTDDGAFTTPDKHIAGAGALKAFFNARPKSRITRHFCTSPAIRIINEGVAEGLCYVQLFEAYPKSAGEPVVFESGPSMIAEYQDQYRKTCDGWRISRRRAKVVMQRNIS